MIPAIALPALGGWALRLLRAAWPLLLFMALIFACWWFFVRPLEATITTLKDDLTEERREHLQTQNALHGELVARNEANLRAAALAADNVRLGREIDQAEAEARAARQQSLNDAIEEIDNATPSWREYRFDPADDYRMCVNVARINGTDRAACGSPPGNDSGTGGAL